MSEREWLGSIFLIAGMVAVYFLERGFAADRRFAARATPATGQVVDTWFETGGDSDVHYVSVKFTVAPDRSICFSAPGFESVGRTVDILYDPENPEDARRKGSVRLNRLGWRLITYGWMLLSLWVLLFDGD
jgi:hypothetical protein